MFNKKFTYDCAQRVVQKDVFCACIYCTCKCYSSFLASRKTDASAMK